MKFLNEWTWKRPVKSPCKKYYAEVLCQHKVHSMDIFILVRLKNGEEVQRFQVISEIPDEFAYAKHLGELKWIAEQEVALINKKGDNLVSVKLNVT